MFKLLCCMKSKESFNRLVTQFNHDYVEWETFVSDLEEVREKSVMSEYDYAVADSRLYWYDDLVVLLNRKSIKIIQFSGDFEDVIVQLEALIKKPNDDTDKVPESGIENNPAKRNHLIHKRVPEEEGHIDKPIYTPMYTGLSKKLICVVNLSKRAGSTFLTLNLAKLLSKLRVMSSVIELPMDIPYIYDMVGLDNKLNGQQFSSFAHLIAENKPIKRDMEFVHDGIVWMVQNPVLPRIDCSQVGWDYYKTMKLIYASKKSNIYLLDCGSHIYDEELKDVLINEADMILVVVDPMPVECMQNEKILDELLELKKDHCIEFIVNRWDKGINKDDLYSFLRTEPLTSLPYVSPNLVYESVYNYKIPFENPVVEEVMMKPLYEIGKKILPEDLLKDYFKKAYAEKKEPHGKSIINIFRRTGK